MQSWTRLRPASLEDAVSRLGACEADGDLVALCQECLAPDRRRRPRDAGAVARRVSAYLASLEERARELELAAAEAAAKAREERRARRLTLALATAVTSSGTWSLARPLSGHGRSAHSNVWRRSNTVAAAMDRAGVALGRARATPTGSDAEWAAALAAGRQVESLLAGDLDSRTRERAEEFLAGLERTDRDREMVRRTDRLTLLGSTHEDLDSWLWMDDQFASAFSDYGIDIEALSADEVVQRIRSSAISEDSGLRAGSLGADQLLPAHPRARPL